MNASDVIHDIVTAQKAHTPRGIVSVCSAHPLVVRATMEHALGEGGVALIESTANQVNQYGGYTGRSPAEFAVDALASAQEVGLPTDRIILGGDHLGPYPWRKESAESAMHKAAELVAACVRAGYTKIHLDASMPLLNDPVKADGSLPAEIAAEREAELAAAAEAVAGGTEPMYVIGSEVPVPGGAGGNDQTVDVTSPETLEETIEQCRNEFVRRGLRTAWTRVFAVVAQLGIEFGDDSVQRYDREAAGRTVAAARSLDGIVLEGHSTDYQRVADLRAMVEDGVAVLKVGPALTFALREAIVGLESVERELFRYRLIDRSRRPSQLTESLQQAMLVSPEYWSGYYTGSEEQRAFSRIYGLSDRARYYWSAKPVADSVATLRSNLESTQIPLTLLSQFVGGAFRSLRERDEDITPTTIQIEAVRMILRGYTAAVQSPSLTWVE